MGNSKSELMVELEEIKQRIDDLDDKIESNEVIASEVEEIREQQSLFAEIGGDMASNIKEINETLESNERHIHILPPGEDINSPLMVFELTGAVFAAVLAVAEFLRTGEINVITTIAIAVAAALVVPPVINFTQK